RSGTTAPTAAAPRPGAVVAVARSRRAGPLRRYRREAETRRGGRRARRTERPPTAVRPALAAERRRPAGTGGPAAAWIRPPRARPRSGGGRSVRAGSLRPGVRGHRCPV